MAGTHPAPEFARFKITDLERDGVAATGGGVVIRQSGMVAGRIGEVSGQATRPAWRRDRKIMS
jgi:hypothetical protein